MKYKVCNNCGARMLFDYVKKRWDCIHCGYAEELEENLRSIVPGYIN